MAVALSGVAQVLIVAGILSKASAETLLADAQQANISFLEHAIKQKAFSASDAAQALAINTNAPYFDLASLNPSVLKGDLVDKKLVADHLFLPLWIKGRTLVIAVSDPTNQEAVAKIKFAVTLGVEVVVVDDDKLRIAREKFISGNETSLANLVGDDDIDLEVTTDIDDAPAAAPEVDEAADSPVVKFVNKMLLDAIQRGASDLHFEPYEKFYRVRFRIDGVLREISTPPKTYTEKIAARIKVMSRLDTSERRVPQDGRTKINISKDKAIDFRVSTCPMIHGEKIVMRILDPSSAQLGIDALGYEPDQKEALLHAISRPYGMVLVTGPTGSGKTVSLYTCLNIINTPSTNISTAEDPVEIPLPGVNQVNVNEKTKLSFSVALKSFLRQDPDVIMVGEIRDLETADIAIKAAQTGHLVLSTLHTNDAPSTLTRLVSMGVKPFSIASSVILVTAQRLARRLCTCKVEISLGKDVLLKAGFLEEQLKEKFTLFGPRPGGCERCSGSGYKGRVGIYQVMPVTEAIEEIILKEGTALDIERQASKDGVKNLRQSGLLKVKQGATSLEEIEAVTNT